MTLGGTLGSREPRGPRHHKEDWHLEDTTQSQPHHKFKIKIRYFQKIPEGGPKRTVNFPTQGRDVEVERPAEGDAEEGAHAQAVVP